MPGALSEFIAVHPSQVVRIPDSMDFDTAAMLEPLGVAYHSIRLSGLTPGQSVAVFGAGAVGLLTLAMAKACGAGETFIADKLQYRLDFASRTYGADHCIHVTSTDPLQYIHTATSGRGVDYTFEAAGQPDTFQWSFESARIGGKALIIGIPEVDSISFNPHTMRRKELTIQNVRRSNMALESCIDLVERKIVSVDGLATHHYSLEHTAKAFATVAGYKDNVIRAVVVPGRDKRQIGYPSTSSG
jgi:L-iditol 2-dehydrogenase